MDTALLNEKYWGLEPLRTFDQVIITLNFSLLDISGMDNEYYNRYIQISKYTYILNPNTQHGNCLTSNETPSSLLAQSEAGRREPSLSSKLVLPIIVVISYSMPE